MSRKQPEIRIVYPDASAAAMLLTEAMIKRSSGRRVVETESTEKEYTGEQLFAGALACKTDTSVELTLRLNPDAMDYALTTLIAKNLTEEERNAIRNATDSMELDTLLSPAQAAEAAGAGTCTEEVDSAGRAADGQQTQSGGLEFARFTREAVLYILNDYQDKLQSGGGTFDANEMAVHRITELFAATPEKPNTDPELEIRLAVLIAYAATFTTKKAAADHYQALQTFATETAKLITDTKDEHPFLSEVLQSATMSFSLDKKETLRSAFLTQMTAHKGERKIYSPEKNRSDKTDETNKTDDIEPGLLNDIEDKEDGEE